MNAASALFDIRHAKTYEIATGQLTVNRQVEECQVSQALANCSLILIAQISFNFNGRFWPISSPLLQRARFPLLLAFVSIRPPR
jgi:hypothetical protein